MSTLKLALKCFFFYLSVTILEFSISVKLRSLLDLLSNDRAQMEAFLVNHESKLDLPVLPAGLGHTIFEYVPNVERGTWEHWSERIVEYKYPTDQVPEYANILVPNVDNVRTQYLIDIIAKQAKV